MAARRESATQPRCLHSAVGTLLQAASRGGDAEDSSRGLGEGHARSLRARAEALRKDGAAAGSANHWSSA
jgi:hypothetical protein